MRPAPLLPVSPLAGWVRFAGVLLLLLAACPARAQTERPRETPDSTGSDERVLEDAAERDENDAENLADLLDELRARPLDINTATAAELAGIPAFSALVAGRIVAYRTDRGRFASLPELQQVPGVTEQVYAEARPFLFIGPRGRAAQRRASPYPAVPSLRALRDDLRLDVAQRYGRRLGTSRAERDTAYEGTPERIATRIRLSSGRRLTLAVTLDKDPGERFAWRPETNTYGYDHVTASLALSRFGRAERLVAGDFTASFGQGLVMWRSGGIGKSRDATRGVARSGAGLAGTAASEENRFFRGAGATVLLTPRVSVTAFGSFRTLDATVGGDSSASAFGTTGLHRTESELARKDALEARMAGGAMRYRVGRVEVGAVGAATRFGRPVDPGDDAYRRFAFRGTSTYAASVFGNAAVGGTLVYGELARDADGAFAGTGGVQMGFGRGNEAVLAVRSFSRRFVSLHGDVFGERGGAPANEQGLYAGVRFRATPRVTVQAYADGYRFPWLRYITPRPTSGLDLLASAEHRPHAWLTYYALVRSETREEGARVADAFGREFASVRPETRTSGRLHGEYRFSRRALLRARVEGVRFHADGERALYGFVLYQDVQVEPARPLTLSLRLALFDTDGYDARVYAYEQDLRYSFSVPALSGRGTRAYALARYRLGGPLTLEARYSETRFEDVTSVGSGLDAIPGRTQRDVRVQLLARF